MEKCRACKGKGHIWVAVKDEVEKDVCDECEGTGYRQDDIPCSQCEDGMLYEVGSKIENAIGEDDSVWLVCDGCGARHNENGQYVEDK